MAYIRGKQIGRGPQGIKAINVDDTEIPTLAADNTFTGHCYVPDVSPSDPPSTVVNKAYVTGYTSVPTDANKNMSAKNTSSGSNQALDNADAITYTPSADGYVEVMVNGIQVWLAPDKNGECYFSNDGGTTARILKDIAAGDMLYWSYTSTTPNAGYDLKTTDKIDLNYNVVPA